MTPHRPALDKRPQTPPESPKAQRSTSTVQVTYSPTEWALLQAKFPMSEDDWGAMIDVLQAMKRGLVGSVVTPKKKKSARSKLQPSYQRADFLHDLGKASRKLEPEGQLPKKKRPSERSGEKS